MDNPTILDGLPTALKWLKITTVRGMLKAKKWIVARAKLHEAEMLIKSKNKVENF